MVNVMDKKEFDKWVGEIFKRKPKHYSCWQIPNTKMIVCVNEKNGKVGVARCHPDDKFVISHGKAIAIARCAGIEVPTLSEYKEVLALKNGDVFIYQGSKYRYIGRISDCSHAVVNILANDRLENFYVSNYMEVEICS